MTAKRNPATRRELLNLLRLLYGDLTSTIADEGAVLLEANKRLRAQPHRLLLDRRVIEPHLKALSDVMDAEDEAKGAF